MITTFDAAQIRVDLVELLNEAAGVLVPGKYLVEATIFSQTNDISAEATALEFEKSSTLDSVDPGSFVADANSTYLQWDSVPGAASYAVTVKKNGTTVTPPTAWQFGNYVVEGENGDRDVVRLNTVALFAQFGFGSYEFSVVAESGSEFIADSEASAYTWVVASALATPRVTIEQNGAEITAKIVSNAQVANYTLTVYGVKKGNPVTVPLNGRELYTTADLSAEFIEAGKYIVTVVAGNAANGYIDSAPAVVEFIYTGTAARPDNVSATQSLENSQVSLKWDSMTETLANATYDEATKEVTAGSMEANLDAAIRVTSLDGTLLYNDGAWMNIGATGSATLADEIYQFMNANAKSTYLIYYKAVEYRDAGMYSGVLLAESGAVPARLAFKIQLNALTFTATQNGADVVLNITSLDTNAGGKIDVLIENGATEVASLNAVAVTGGEYTILGSNFPSRGDYTISVRAAKNGIYEAGAYAEQPIAYQAVLGQVTGITLTPTKDEGTGELTALQINFNLLTEDAFTGDITYQASLNYAGKSFDFGTDGLLSAAGIEAIKGVWAANAQFEIVIIATPTDATYASVSTTTYTYTVGAVAMPTDFVFTQNGQNVTVSWTPDATYNTAEYTWLYNYAISVNGGTATTGATDKHSATFALPSDYATKSYTIEFTITGITVSKEGAPVADNPAGETATAYFVNTVSGLTLSGMTVEYVPANNNYIVTFTHNANSTAHLYDISLGGMLVARGATLDGGKITLSVSLDVLQALINGEKRAVTYEIVASDVTITTGDSRTYIAYQGDTYTGTVDLPVVLVSPIDGLEYDENTMTATWDEMEFVAQYTWVLTDANGVQGTGAVATNSVNLAGTLANLPAGNYTLTISANGDETKQIYTTPTAKASIDITKVAVMPEVISFNFTTQGNGVDAEGVSYGDFATTLSWTNNAKLQNDQFEIIFTSVASGQEFNLTQILKDAGKLDDMVGYAQSGQNHNYTLLLSGLDIRTGTAVKNIDPTRGWAAGDYTVTIRVLSGGAENTENSSAKPAPKLYKNMFGVKKAAQDKIFAIAPDCYISEGEVANGEITFAGADAAARAEYLSQYEAKYGFNRKYLVITQTGQDATRAPTTACG